MSERRIVAEDGTELALHRLRAHRDGRCAVLLVHGMFSNHSIWLLPSLAQGGFGHFLSARGFDVWLADIRHHGASAREPSPFQWRFEDWVLRDAPALVARVCEETSGAPLAWVGHSVGGAVGLCWLARLRNAVPLAAVVTFGTPGPGAMSPLRWALARGAIAVARALGRFPARGLRLGAEDEGAAVVADWMGWNLRGRWVGGDGFDYFEALADVHTPLLAVAGEGDRVYAPPRACRLVVDAIGAPRKELAVVGPRLTHQGMLTAPRARETCWPRVASWLEETLRAA